MNLTLDSRHIPDGDWWPSPPDNLFFSRISTDSRSVFQPASTLFFCLRGPRHDGHLFIRDAWNQGVRHFVVDHVPEEMLPETRYLLVRHTLDAMQQLARGHRQQFHGKVVGITGSNGKTMVKEWLYLLLREDTAIMRSPRSFNSQVGVPLSLSMIGPEHELAIIEAGVSRMGEMERLREMIQPDTGILTSFGSAHDEGFADRETKLREKLKLFENSQRLVMPDWIRRAYPDILAPWQDRLVTWSVDKGTDLQIVNKVAQGQAIHLDLIYGDQEGHALIPHSDQASFENAMTCLLAGLVLGYDLHVLCHRIGDLPSLSMRLETREGWQGNLIINDSYNADLEGLRIALSFLHQRKGNRSTWVVLTDLDDSGLDTSELVRRIAQLLQDATVDRLSFIGAQGPALATLLGAHPQIQCFPDVHAFNQETDFQDIHQTAILFKGARRFALESISRSLTRFVHRTRLEINLTALTHNVRVIARQLKPETRIMVMVKASAYGSGSPDIARLLENQRIHYLGVAYADEGVELRQAGVRLPILVMNADSAGFPSMIQHQLEPQIHSLDQFRELLRLLSPSDPVIPVHLKLETGMHRLGLEEQDLGPLIDLLSRQEQVLIRSCFSHLVASENPEHDAFTHEQARRFCRLTDRLSEGLGYRPLFHLLNSSGIRRFPEYQFDMVRLGIGIYGLDPTEQGHSDAMVHALCLKTHVSRVHRVPAGESVGYGRKGRADHDRTIATLGIGYADGLLRLAGEGRFSVLIRGQLAPTVGAICMDMCMVDVSHIPTARAGDEVIIFGSEHPIRLLADSLQTIPYEVLTNISPRVNRIYFHE